LVAPLAQRLARADDQLKPLASGLDLYQEASKTVPAALGATQPQAYLLLLPNPTELRPAGGYSGAVGTLTFNHGDPVFKIGDQYSLNGHYKEHFDVPPTIGRYLHYANNSFEIGDSLWDPDFPSSARLGMRMYQSATGIATVGEVAIDPYALADLLAITGPIEVKPYGSFDSSNILNKLNVLINVDNASKDSIGLIGEAVFGRVIAQPPAKWADLAKALQKDVLSRHIQVFASESGLEGLVERGQAAGQLQGRARLHGDP